MTDVVQSFQLVVDFLRKKGFIKIATKLENNERVKIGKISNAPTRLEALLLKGYAFEQNHPEELDVPEDTSNDNSRPIDIKLDKKPNSLAKTKQMGLSKSMNTSLLYDKAGDSSSFVRSNAPIVSMAARDSGKIIGLPSFSRIVFRHSREPHTPLRAIDKERRATSATVSRLEDNPSSPEQSKKSEGDEYSDDEDIGFTLSNSLDKVSSSKTKGPKTRGNIEIYPKQQTDISDSSSSDDSEDDDLSDEPKTSIFPLELDETSGKSLLPGKPIKKKSITMISKETLQNLNQKQQSLNTLQNLNQKQQSLNANPVSDKPVSPKETNRPKRKKTVVVSNELDFSDCNIISNAGDPKIEYFNLKVSFY